jgi:hypothetical protein
MQLLDGVGEVSCWVSGARCGCECMLLGRDRWDGTRFLECLGVLTLAGVTATISLTFCIARVRCQAAATVLSGDNTPNSDPAATRHNGTDFGQ